MQTIDLAQPNSAAVRAYFDGIGLPEVPEPDDYITAEPSVPCQGCGVRIVPWFDFCQPCVCAERCDHADTDRIQGNGWTACAACGEVLAEEDR